MKYLMFFSTDLLHCSFYDSCCLISQGFDSIGIYIYRERGGTASFCTIIQQPVGALYMCMCIIYIHPAIQLSFGLLITAYRPRSHLAMLFNTRSSVITSSAPGAPSYTGRDDQKTLSNDSFISFSLNQFLGLCFQRCERHHQTPLFCHFDRLPHGELE